PLWGARRGRTGRRRGGWGWPGQGPAATGRRGAAQSHCRSRPAGEYRRLMRIALPIFAAVALSACGLHPLYGGGSAGSVASTLRSVAVTPISGQSGWLVRNKLVDRLGDTGGGTATYRLDVTLDDNITAFGLSSNQAATQERRT